MREKIIAEMQKRLPQHAEGHIQIDLTDPLTGRVKERVNGENHVFMDTVFAQKTHSSYFYNFSPWTSSISNNELMLMLTDSTLDIDDELPIVFGNIVGCGKPSTGSSGLLQGAYNAANQKLAVYNGNSIYWKFQYDFTTAQAIGSISTIGLSYQNYNYGCILPQQIPSQIMSFSGELYNSKILTNDGKFLYTINAEGNIIKLDILNSTVVTIDKPDAVYKKNCYCKVGYDPSTKYYYIMTYDRDIAENRKLYRFSDNTFSTLLASFSLSNASYPYYNQAHPVYIYGDYLFCFYSEYAYICDYAVNTNFTAQIPLKSSFFPNNAVRSLQNYPLPLKNRYVHLGGGRESTGIIYDLQAQNAVAFENVTSCELSYNWAFMNTYPGTKIPCFKVVSNEAAKNAQPVIITNPAISAKKLDAPVIKTEANGMTVTYELEVFY